MKSLFILAVSLYSLVAFSHRGGTASDGCHKCKSNCESYGYTTGARHSHKGKVCDPAKGTVDNKKVVKRKAKRVKISKKGSYNLYKYSTNKVTSVLMPVYKNRRMKTFYCSCDFKVDKSVSHASCGFKYHKKIDRSYRIEWEHIVPQSYLKRLKMSPLGDLHNLVPAVGTLNMKRSNKAYGFIKNEPREYGSCDFEDNSKTIEAMPSVRGNIARSYLYMEKRYSLPISKSEKKLFLLWDKKDPPTKFECYRNNEIGKIQGNLNPFVTKYCIKIN
ncbi:hypothetical protein A9Q84_00210 [Halobacteriovorax marinus]|uniref:Endonuclease I n=1 Tax=Halobacteriovorax marinus TaxID=97084 RepID=A0A1Y5FD31_9BACT|nr:hypothetical protein A9Q84_00210 [Halobacteriovorax marinus]